jgi:glycine/D-amino acid oxidase-like deaminating enzyme
MVKFFEEPEGIWAGDGTAIKPDNWTIERLQKSYERMRDFVAQDGGVPSVGIRPYVPKAKPAYVEEVQPGVWVATGGAKNGLVAAGWAAHRILERAVLS